MRVRLTCCASLVLFLSATGCGAVLRRFPLRDPLWVDADDRAFSPRPPSWYSPYIWDGMDNAGARPLAENFALELDHEAVNVNALDEVPTSSWFTNRLGRSALAPDAVARGACDAAELAIPGVDQDVGGPFLITRGKPDGSTHGFFVRDRQGRTFLLKPDSELQPEHASAAEAISAAVFWAAGYFAPCNRVVYVDPSELTLEPGAQADHSDGTHEPLTQEFVDSVVEAAAVDGAGRRRFAFSELIEGDPISAWTYEGTWDADPNDVVPHEARRDLRGMFVLAAWLGRIDSRQENTVATWIASDDSHGHVRHYLLDFSETLGVLNEDDALARRFGHAGYIDLQYMFEDFVTLGLIERPWQHVELGPAGTTLGYFDVRTFEPEQWRPGYPNPAFDRMTEHDAAWMARILARFGDAHIRALAQRGRFTSPTVRDELERVLRGRRDRILERWLTRLSPLTEPRAEEDASGTHRLCLEDRAVTSGFREAASRRYEASAWALGSGSARSAVAEPTSEGVCVRIAADSAPGGGASEYVVIDVVASTEHLETTAPLRVHAYEVGGALRVVGIERLEHVEGPPS